MRALAAGVDARRLVMGAAMDRTNLRSSLLLYPGPHTLNINPHAYKHTPTHARFAAEGFRRTIACASASNGAL